jgi:hypothetical protein
LWAPIPGIIANKTGNVEMRPVQAFRMAALLCCLVAAGCSVRLVSPYTEEIAKRASKLHEDVIAFELTMRRQVGTRAGDPRNDVNQRRFDEWQASVATMATLSAAADPRVVRCQDILPRVTSSSAAIDPSVAQALHEQGSEAGPAGMVDCQTLGITRSSQRLDQLRRLYTEFCRVPTLPDTAFHEDRPRAVVAAVPLPDCQALWAPTATGAALGLAGSHGLGVDPVLRSIRAVIAVQESKRSNAN